MNRKHILFFSVWLLLSACSNQRQSSTDPDEKAVTSQEKSAEKIADTLEIQEMEDESAPQPQVETNDLSTNVDVERKDTLGLIVLYPHFSTVDLVCGSLPSRDDNRVILFAEAAYTGELLDSFKHTNIAGDHVSSGQRYPGYKCKRNTGAFVYYKGQWKFCYQNYATDLADAARNGGCGFGQELIIHKGKLVSIVRKDGNKNQFRALCDQQGRLCIVESVGTTRFGDFKKKLLAIGVTDAIYLDMGAGWNHAWYRSKGKIIELHPKLHNYCTNWITFFN